MTARPVNSPPRLTLLALETSCDETGVALVRGDADTIEVLANAVASQIDIHAATGGVIPEIAAREHVQVLRPLLTRVMSESGLDASGIDGIAVTIGPGLQPALAVGVTAARTLAYAWHKPLVPVHHLEGHIYSALLAPAASIKEDSQLRVTSYELPVTNVFPALALIVSGGHTMLLVVRGHLQYEILGSTKDDAAGEAFDKVARLLELPYPGGPHLSKLAERGNAEAFAFPHPMAASGDLNFSFSGLKTAVLYAWRDIPDERKEAAKADIAASFERAVVETLVAKTKQAVLAHQPQRVLLAGGVAANTRLREQLLVGTRAMSVPLHIAPSWLCGDNAAMIGMAGIFAHRGKRQASVSTIDAHARIDLTSLTPPAVRE